MLTTTNTDLLVVDIQGKLARLVEGSNALISNAARLVAGARLLGLPVVWLEQNPDKLGATVPELQSLQAGDLVLPKYSFGALGEPAVATTLATVAVYFAIAGPAVQEVLYFGFGLGGSCTMLLRARRLEGRSRLTAPPPGAWAPPPGTACCRPARWPTLTE